MIETELVSESFLPPVSTARLVQTGLRCGDLLLTFQKAGGVLPCRYGQTKWEITRRGDSWELLHDDFGTTWKGYPLSEGEVQDWNFVLLGELNGLDQNSYQLLDALHSVVMGIKGAETLNGHFLLLAYNQQDRHWHVFTDRFGTLHAYYASDGWGSAVGTFSAAVASAASRKQLDWSALTAFFAQGFFPADRTFFDDIQVLQPASHYVFDATGKMREQKRYWHWWHQPDRSRSYDETVDEFGDIFREVMRDHTRNGRVALPISGGLDSRSTTTIAGNGQTNGEGGNLWAYSYGYNDDSPETAIARRVASARGLPFQGFTIKPYLFEKLDLVLDSVEGFQDITQCRQAAVLDEIAPNADYVIAAHWGDVWMDTMGLADRDVANDNGSDLDDEAIVAHTLGKIRKTGSEWLLENVAGPHLKQGNADEILADTTRQEMAKLREIKCPDFRLKAFKTDNWSFRWTVTSLRMFQPAAFPRLPFYDTRLTDFFCSVPSEFVRGRRLQIDHLRRVAPDLARIKWQAYDANLFDYQKNSKLLPKRAMKKAWRLLTQKKSIERNWEVQFLNPEGRAGLEAMLLEPGLRLHEFASPSKVRGLLEQFYTDPYTNKRGYTVSMLLTLSAWLEKNGSDVSLN